MTISTSLTLWLEKSRLNQALKWLEKVLSKPRGLLAAWGLAFSLGLYLTYPGRDTWDSYFHLQQSKWLIQNYLGGREEIYLSPHVTWYGPLWELILGVFSEIFFKWVQEPTWIRNSLNFSLYVMTLLGTYRLLILQKVERETAFLAVTLAMGYIRLGGHSLFNTKDLPLACASLLVPLALLYFYDQISKKPKRQRWRFLALGTFISLAPYLVRPPILTYFGTWLILMMLIKPKKYRISWQELFFIFGISPLLIVGLWPTLWTTDLTLWAEPFRIFSKFPWVGWVRFFGKDYPSNLLPVSYPWVWPWIGFTPFTLFFSFVGICSLFFLSLRQKKMKPASKILAFFGGVQFILILAQRPVLYDEDRHLLFNYFWIPVLGGLGLSWIRPSRQLVLGVLALILSLASYLQWGKYSYVYISPLTRKLNSDFMGDYWAVCTSELANQLKNQSLLTGEGSLSLLVEVPKHNFELQWQRYQFGLLSKVDRLPKLNWVNLDSESKVESTYYRASYRRKGEGGTEKTLLDVQAGKAKLIFSDRFPTGEVACTLALYSNSQSTP